MRDPYVVSEAQLAGLLDDHLTLVRHSLRTALPATAIRTRSFAARQLLARAALGDAATLAELLAAARSADVQWLQRIRRRVQPTMVAGLAQTLALQNLLPEDLRDALAVYELIRSALGPDELASGHQGLHAQLAFVADGPQRARALVAGYPQVREQVLVDLRIDLLNPFTVAGAEAGSPVDAPAGTSGGAVEAWLTAFRTLMPPPGLTLLPETELAPSRPAETEPAETKPAEAEPAKTRPAGTEPAGSEVGRTPFDRLAAPETERIDGPQRISVIVTSYRPDVGLLTAVRSILAQSWRNVEVIVVDDASPVEYDDVLHRCLALGERIRLVRLPVNAGTYAARNAGLDASEGEFVTFQDSDDWSHPRRLELQVAPLLADPTTVASTSDGVAVTDDLVMTRPSVRSGRFNPSSLLFRRDAVMRRLGYFDALRKAADSEYIGRIQAVFGEQSVHHVEAGPLALIRLSANSLSRAEIRAFWMHPARVAYSSAYLRWHEQIAAGEADPYRPRDGSRRPFAAPEHLRELTSHTRAYDVVVVADWRFLQGTVLAAVDELRAMASAGLRVAIVHLETFRTVVRRRLPLAGAVQQLINDGTVDQVYPYEAHDVALVVVRQPTVLQFPSDVPWELRPRRVLVVADRAPARADGTDRRYVPVTCTAAARRMFGVDPIWCPQDPGVRAALYGTGVETTAFDLPQIVDVGRWVAHRDTTAPDRPVVGTDLCDSGAWPADLGDALRVHRRLPATAADVRVRLPDLIRPDPVPGLPVDWLVYAAADLDARTFAHQLDLYLHFPHPDAPETFSRPALEAAAAGCVVVVPERFEATYGETAVTCAPAGVAALVTRFGTDHDAFAEQSRRARERVAKDHHPRLFVDRVHALLRPSTVQPPAQRSSGDGDAPAQRAGSHERSRPDGLP